MSKEDINIGCCLLICIRFRPHASHLLPCIFLRCRYVRAKHSYNATWPLKQDDFFGYADFPHAYWTGRQAYCAALCAMHSFITWAGAWHAFQHAAYNACSSAVQATSPAAPPARPTSAAPPPTCRRLASWRHSWGCQLAMAAAMVCASGLTLPGSRCDLLAGSHVHALTTKFGSCVPAALQVLPLMPWKRRLACCSITTPSLALKSSMLPTTTTSGFTRVGG